MRNNLPCSALYVPFLYWKIRNVIILSLCWVENWKLVLKVSRKVGNLFRDFDADEWS